MENRQYEVTYRPARSTVEHTTYVQAPGPQSARQHVLATRGRVVVLAVREVPR